MSATSIPSARSSRATVSRVASPSRARIVAPGGLVRVQVGLFEMGSVGMGRAEIRGERRSRRGRVRPGEQHVHDLGAGARLQLRRGARRDDLAVVQHVHLVGEPVRLLRYRVVSSMVAIRRCYVVP